MEDAPAAPRRARQEEATAQEAAAAAVAILLGVRIGDFISTSYSDASSPDQADVFEMDYLEASPPGSLGERLMITMEGDDNV